MDETNGTSSRPACSALDEAEELVAQAGDLRTRLEAERAELTAKIRRIDSMLAKLPGDRTEGGRGTGAAGLGLAGLPATIERTDTIPGLLLSIVAESSSGMTSREVIAVVKKRRPKVKPNDVLAGLWRLHRKKGSLRADGPKGSMRYFVADPEEVSP
jgi:hypothetical protein